MRTVLWSSTKASKEDAEAFADAINKDIHHSLHAEVILISEGWYGIVGGKKAKASYDTLMTLIDENKKQKEVKV